MSNSLHQTFEAGERVFVQLPKQNKLVEAVIRKYFPHSKHYSLQVGGVVRIMRGDRIRKTAYVKR